MTTPRKINIGCGNRFADGWTNIDFHSSDARVLRVNLLAGLPFPSASFDAAYSSHVLEHFTRPQGLDLLKEIHRILRPGGIVRIVVPDLEQSCREYLRILDLPGTDPRKKRLHRWIRVELLDQLVRTESAGELGPLMHEIMTGTDEDLKAYALSRTENVYAMHRPPAGWKAKLRNLTPQKLATKKTYLYLKLVRMLVPRNLRPMVWVGTEIGERHRFMYDRYSLPELMTEAGFRNPVIVDHATSSIPGFAADLLDTNADGSSYKNLSLYGEAVR